MSGISGSQRFTAVLAAVLLLLAAPLGAPAYADPGRVDLSVILDSPEVMANISNSSGPAITAVVTYDVFDAAGNGLAPVTSRTAGAGLGGDGLVRSG